MYKNSGSGRRDTLHLWGSKTICPLSGEWFRGGGGGLVGGGVLVGGWLVGGGQRGDGGNPEH